MLDLDKMEEVVGKYVAEGRKDDAVKVIFELIERHAKQKNFTKAEALRDRLFEVDPGALMEIVKAADIIDEQKSKAVDKNHMEVWSLLYSGLSVDESNTLHFAMQERNCEANETVFSQGDEDASLYFIDQGQLKMVYSHQGYEYLIKDIGPGELVGADTFFANAAFCTHSLITLSRVKLNYLENKAVEKWEQECPRVFSRLVDHCGRFQPVEELLKKKGYDRRAHKRINFSAKGVIQFLDSAGQPSGRAILVTLADLSMGGASFYLRFTKQATAGLLLARGLLMKFAVSVGGSQKDVTKRGLVVGVRNHGFGEYSLHIKFDKLLPDKLIAVLESTSGNAPKNTEDAFETMLD